MMCYKDMTFCAYHEDCRLGKDCPRALTKEVEDGAEKWWGSKDAPICMYLDIPHCFEAKHTVVNPSVDVEGVL